MTQVEMPPPVVCLIVAVAENGVIGRDGGLPWRLSSDLKRFRQLTMGKPLIMGRKTYQSIGKPLDGRDNIVVTSDADFRAEGVLPAVSVEAALAVAQQCAGQRGTDEIMVIGGAQIYEALLGAAGRIYLTRVHGRPEGDVVLPEFPSDQWDELRREALPRGARDDFDATLIVLGRRKLHG